MTAIEIKLAFWILLFLIPFTEMECKFFIVFIMAVVEIELKL